VAYVRWRTKEKIEVLVRYRTDHQQFWVQALRQFMQTNKGDSYEYQCNTTVQQRART